MEEKEAWKERKYMVSTSYSENVGRLGEGLKLFQNQVVIK